MAIRDPEFMTIAQAARLFHVHPETIRRWILDGRINATRPGPRSIRIPESEVRRLLRDSPATAPEREAVAS